MIHCGSLLCIMYTDFFQLFFIFLQNAEKFVSEMGYKDIPPVIQDFFVVLKDVTQDTTIRALSFSLLMKTTDSKTIQNLVDIMMKGGNTIQMKAYMTSAVRTLLENDAPHLKVYVNSLF